MNEFLSHPLNAIADLAAEDRLLIAGLVLGATVVVAGVVGWLMARWARKRASAGSALGRSVEERVRALRRSLAWFVGFTGAYLAAQAAPLPETVQTVVAGAAFVCGAIAVTRALIQLVLLFLVSWVLRAPDASRDHIERDYVPLLQKLIALVAWLLAVVVVARHFGRDVSSLIAALGVGSLAIGLAAQQTLGNMIAGFVVLVDRPFRPGDRVRLATGELGDVLEVGVRSTRILLRDKNLLIVPNAELANSRVVNLMSLRSEITVTVAHDADVERALSILLEICKDERVRDEPAAAARVSAIHDGGVDLIISYEVRIAADGTTVEDAVRREILRCFAAAAIPLARRAPK